MYSFLRKTLSMHFIFETLCDLILYFLQILPPPISRADFEKVLSRQKATVGKNDLEVHERFTKEFGEEG